MNNLTHCPICGGVEFKPFLKGIDYTVSKEEFNIQCCTACNFHFTNPIPEATIIGDYYKSEDYISHSSTSKGVVNKLYQFVRRITLKQKVQLVSEISNGRDVLDIGAGTGHFLNACKKGGWNTIGLEPDVDARNFAKQNFGLELLPADQLHGLENGTKDVITMWHVLEHVYDLKKDVQKIVNLLKDDGKLVIAVPNKNSYDAKVYGEFWAAYDLPIHLYHFTPKDIENLFSQFDMELKRILPMKFDAFYISMLSEKYRGGNLLNAFWNGLSSNWKAKKGTYSSQIYILSKKRI